MKVIIQHNPPIIKCLGTLNALVFIAVFGVLQLILINVIRGKHGRSPKGRIFGNVSRDSNLEVPTTLLSDWPELLLPTFCGKFTSFFAVIYAKNGVLPP